MSKLEYSFRHCSVRVKDKELLNDVQGSVLEGEIFGIMGPSGAGKTTLLNALTFNLDGAMNAEGNMSVNSIETSIDDSTGKLKSSCTDTVPFSTSDQFRRFCVYIPQHDFQFPTLTCREMMMYTAQFFSETKSRTAAAEAVDSMIKEMGLSSCADTKIGGL